MTAPDRRFSAGDLVAVVLGVGSIVVMTGTTGSNVVLAALVVVLVAWPAALLAMLMWRWIRQGDRRFVAATTVLFIVAIGAVLVSRWLAPGS
ncbi:MAG: hypothetical protein WD377_00815 [Nitriliruptoraceae bacterium]